MKIEAICLSSLTIRKEAGRSIFWSMFINAFTCLNVPQHLRAIGTVIKKSKYRNQGHRPNQINRFEKENNMLHGNIKTFAPS
jgi:hypothetical protein